MQRKRVYLPKTTAYPRSVSGVMKTHEKKRKTKSHIKANPKYTTMQVLLIQKRASKNYLQCK